MNSKRQSGFYWVRSRFGRWQIAEWLSGDWFVTGRDGTFIDNDFEEIDETPIVRYQESKLVAIEEDVNNLIKVREQAKRIQK